MNKQGATSGSCKAIVSIYVNICPKQHIAVVYLCSLPPMEKHSKQIGLILWRLYLIRTPLLPSHLIQCLQCKLDYPVAIAAAPTKYIFGCCTLKLNLDKLRTDKAIVEARGGEVKSSSGLKCHVCLFSLFTDCRDGVLLGKISVFLYVALYLRVNGLRKAQIKSCEIAQHIIALLEKCLRRQMRNCPDGWLVEGKQLLMWTLSPECLINLFLRKVESLPLLFYPISAFFNPFFFFYCLN